MPRVSELALIYLYFLMVIGGSLSFTYQVTSFLFFVVVKTERNPSRIVLLIWLFVVLIINASYTASLASILTLQQLSSPIKGIKTLINSNDPIGYQQGSYARSYLVEELGIHESRLVPLNSAEDYAKALKDGPQRGGVVAVVDDRAYVELFLSTRCEFSIEGQEFIKAGWGFVSISFINDTALPGIALQLAFGIHVS